MTVSICAPAALGVAAKRILNDPDCGVNGLFTHPAPASAVKQSFDCAWPAGGADHENQESARGAANLIEECIDNR